MADVMVVGNGLIGRAVGQDLRASGHRTVTVARSGADLTLDLGAESGRAALAAQLRHHRPDRVVLTHGPSDVTWIEGHEDEAAAVHVGVAELVAAAGVPAVMVSTDNVFDGTRGSRAPSDEVVPGNAYGRIKLAAERALAPGLALRVSLVYGWTGARHRSTYGQQCLTAALAGEPLLAPTDQDFTPIHVDDVAKVLTGLCGADHVPDGVLHLAGPQSLSRHEFAGIAYRVAGADPGLVRPVLRRDTRWASRPRHSSLACSDFSAIVGIRGWRPIAPQQGLELMLSTMPQPVAGP